MKAIIAILAVTLAASSSNAEPPDRIEQVTLERTVCFGTCPAYRVTISSDGVVRFEGKSYVKVSGIRRKRINAKALQELADEVARVNYFGLRNQYASANDGCPMSWTDNPSVTTSVRTAHITKTVYHYLGCREGANGSVGKSYPQVLTSFEDAIDRIAGTADWIGTSRESARNR
jgi:hypothetical protein